MIPYVTEIAAISVIATILAVYLVILRRSGWLGGTSGDLYRCPNQQCKRVFQKPAELKDLSETPTRVYPACPHCGVDLGPLLASFAQSESVSFKRSFRARKPEPQMEKPMPRKETLQPKILGQKMNPQSNTLKPAESLKTEIKVDKTKPPGVPPQRSESSFEHKKESEKTNEKPQIQAPNPTVTRNNAVGTNAQASTDKPAVCSHFFGYLRTLPKASLIPKPCYSCSRMVDCYCQEANSGSTA